MRRPPIPPAVCSAARQRGFTLLEVLVALAVLAIALAAVIDKTAESGANLSALRDRTLAHWVAENKLAEMQAMEEWREGRQDGEAELAGRVWYWELEALATPAPNLRRVTVRVSDREDMDNQLAVLDGFLLNPKVRTPMPAFPPGGGPGGDDDGGLSGDGGLGGDDSLPPGGEPPQDSGGESSGGISGDG